MIRWTPHRAEWLLYGWLKQFLQYDHPFPIPVRTLGEEVIKEARTNPRGMVTVSVHLPLGIFIVRSLMELDCTPDAVIAAGHSLKHGMFPIWGKVTALQGLTPDGNVLVKARSILRRGGSIGAMIDHDLGAPINANLLHLLGSIGGRLVFALAELQPSGELLVQFYDPPDPFCRCREGISKNLEFIQQKVDDILRRSLQPMS